METPRQLLPLLGCDAEVAHIAIDLAVQLADCAATLLGYTESSIVKPLAFTGSYAGDTALNRFMETARFWIECMPRIPLWGGFKIGVDSSDPKTPPLVIVKVPPWRSLTEMVPSRALTA